MTSVERGSNSVVGVGAELVDFHDPFHLDEEPVDEAEISLGRGGYCSDPGCIRGRVDEADR